MTAAPASSRPPVGFAQLVALVAMLMALNALAIDTMLPLGALIVWVAPWPWIFVVLGLWGLAVQIWALWSLPETLHPEDRMPVQAARVLDAFRVTLTTRRAVGYMLAMAAILGCLFGFINSSQQIFADVFGEAQLFPIIFAIIAGFIAAASLLNARLVERQGMRRISHAALLGFVAFSAGHLVAALAGFETLVVFSVLQAAVMFCFGLIMGNFGAMAMEPLGRIAGTASSVQGFVTTLGGAAGGYVIGQLFDGTTAPLAGGFLICGLTALGFVLWAEGGRLFGSQTPAGA